jgi:cholesterol transport system auxiliary component
MKKYCLLYAAGVLLQGCSETARVPALHDFGVGPLPPPAASPHNAATEEVRVVAPKWLSDNRIRYRLLYDQPTRVRFYNLDQWIAPPPDLLRLYLASEPLDPNYALVIQLMNFEQQFEAPGSASVFLRFSAEAFAAGGKNKAGMRTFVLWSGKVSPDAQGAVQGFTELAGRARQQVSGWLRELPKPHRSGINGNKKILPAPNDGAGR